MKPILICLCDFYRIGNQQTVAHGQYNIKSPLRKGNRGRKYPTDSGGEKTPRKDGVKKTPTRGVFRVLEAPPGRRQVAYRKVRFRPYGFKTQKNTHKGCFPCFGGATRNRTGDKGFADLCLTAWLWRHPPSFRRRFMKKSTAQYGFLFLRLRHGLPFLERITGLEPATSTLARWRSTK